MIVDRMIMSFPCILNHNLLMRKLWWGSFGTFLWVCYLNHLSLLWIIQRRRLSYWLKSFLHDLLSNWVQTVSILRVGYSIVLKWKEHHLRFLTFMVFLFGLLDGFLLFWVNTLFSRMSKINLSWVLGSTEPKDKIQRLSFWRFACFGFWKFLNVI